MGIGKTRLKYACLLTSLVICALLLAGRLVYLFVDDAQRFPINTVKITASYQHITRKQLETILSHYLDKSFFSLSTGHLCADLAALDWAEQARIQRVWPDTLKITLVEKSPVATWNSSLITQDGTVFNVGKQQPDTSLPRLSGPINHQLDVLQIYQKLSKLLAMYGLHAVSLRLRENQAWELSLSNGIQLHLGKQELEQRLRRFCKAYPAVFADKTRQIADVDLRYAHGMAVRWK